MSRESVVGHHHHARHQHAMSPPLQQAPLMQKDLFSAKQNKYQIYLTLQMCLQDYNIYKTVYQIYTFVVDDLSDIWFNQHIPEMCHEPVELHCFRVAPHYASPDLCLVAWWQRPQHSSICERACNLDVQEVCRPHVHIMHVLQVVVQ